MKQCNAARSESFADGDVFRQEVLSNLRKTLYGSKVEKENHLRIHDPTNGNSAEVMIVDYY